MPFLPFLVYNTSAMTPRVRTAVIPAAGLGTRFLPATKAIPKELVPLLGVPTIHYIVQEAVDAGIEKIVIVVSASKSAIKTYFSKTPQLEEYLIERGLHSQANEIKRLAEMAQFTFVVQDEQRGLGHAVLCAREVVGKQTFAVLLPDDLIFGNEPLLTTMLRDWGRLSGSYLAVEEVPDNRVSSYGIIEGRALEESIYRVTNLVEKPVAHEAPSNLGIVGRYILEPQIFEYLDKTPPDAKGEIQLTDGIAMLLSSSSVYAHRFSGTRYDCGSPIGLLEASIEVALKHEESTLALRNSIERLWP